MTLTLRIKAELSQARHNQSNSRKASKASLLYQRPCPMTVFDPIQSRFQFAAKRHLGHCDRLEWLVQKHRRVCQTRPLSCTSASIGKWIFCRCRVRCLPMSRFAGHSPRISRLCGGDQPSQVLEIKPTGGSPRSFTCELSASMPSIRQKPCRVIACKLIGSWISPGGQALPQA